MKKLALAGLGGLVAVAAVAAPWYTGQQTEVRYNEVVAEANLQGSGLTLNTESYERGYGSSEIITRIQLALPEKDQQSVRVRTHVSHGLSGITAESRLITEDFSALVEVFGKDQAGWPVLTSRVGLSGDVSADFVMPAVERELEKGEKLRVDPLASHLELNAAQDRLKMTLDWPGLTVTEDKGVLTLGAVTLRNDTSRLTEHLWLGDSSLKLASMTFNGPDKPPFVLENLALTAQASDVGNQRVDTGVQLAIGRVQIDDVSGADHRFGFKLSGVSLPELDQLMSTVDEINKISPVDPQAQFTRQMELVGRFAGEARQLAARGITLSIPELLVNTREGAVKGQLEISHPELAAAGKDGEAASFLVMEKLIGNLDVSIPVALVSLMGEPAQSNIQQLQAQGFVTEADNAYHLQARLANMQLDVNGQMIPVPPMF